MRQEMSQKETGVSNLAIVVSRRGDFVELLLRCSAHYSPLFPKGQKSKALTESHTGSCFKFDTEGDCLLSRTGRPPWVR